ncbi:M15 family metallopeptidase [Candidatus Saccharibacteria bacterium]|nr:M15 family metallopeptidase [Candidatus Saccharibacteria bacterium]
MKRKKTMLVFTAVVIVVSLIAWQPKNKNDSYTDSKTDNINQPKTNSFDKKQHSTEEPDSLWVIVNKGRKLSRGYIPSELLTPTVPLRFSASSAEMKLKMEAANALERLFASAEEQNLQLLLVSGYRSYSSQEAIYSRNVKRDGQAKTDATSARAGHSEHQTGLAVDVGSKSRKCELDKCFGSTTEGLWVEANAYKFGFIVRYQNGKQNLTGYDYEPWHLRYVGTELASEIYRSNQTLELFFGLPTYSIYSTNSIQLRL